ncbi:MAG: hypothetical protein JW983_00690 [Elusimicrobia bacterium]|nr:hypothetical protein [Elusimicrobiota bacterium]
MRLDEARFVEIVSELIKFKSSTTRIPIKATSWEELICATLIFMYGADKINWDPQSHEKSIDITFKTNGDIFKVSAKAGEIKKGILTISSYRLTTFNTLNEKLNFIKKQHNSFDFYLICARAVEGNFITYNVIKAQAKRLADAWFTDNKNWSKSSGGYILKSGLGFNANICHKMSDQLWYSIPMSYFNTDEVIAHIPVNKNDLGKGLVEFLKERFLNNK